MLHIKPVETDIRPELASFFERWSYYLTQWDENELAMICNNVVLRYRHPDNDRRSVGLRTSEAKAMMHEYYPSEGIYPEMMRDLATVIDVIAHRSPRQRWTFPTDKKGNIIVKNECYLP